MDTLTIYIKNFAQLGI